MARACALIILQSILCLTNCFLHQYPKINLGERDDGDPGKPLFLTEYVESGKIKEGKHLARVPLAEQFGIKSYAGFFTVNKTHDSNQFFWYFPAIDAHSESAPVILWLQGGPGGSSLFGLFSENGPITVENNVFKKRKYNWASNHHVIYIDNPVGTGFSFTKDPKGYCTDETQVGEQLYETLIQFFTLFPELQKNEFFVTGESYGGKYVPALAYTIHKRNPTARLKINLKGMAIGNGFSDPEHQLVYSKYLYQIGLIDWNQAKVLEKYENEIIDYIKQGDWDKASDRFDTLLFGNVINMTGFDFFYNYLHTEDYINEDFGPKIQQSAVRRGIHVGDLPFNDGQLVADYLQQDVMKSITPWIAELLDSYNMMIYSGQIDIIVAYPLTINYLRNLNFTAAKEYKTAERHIWKVDGEVAGYVKEAGNLMEVLVRNAGHMVPTDQPKWALDLITKFTHGVKLYNN